MPLPNTPLSSLPIVVFDTETTGLFTMSAWMVEIAGVRMTGSMVSTGVFQTLVRPDAIIPPDATKVHGITDDEVRDAPPTADVLRAFFDWATTCRAFKDNGEPFRTIDDIYDDLGFIPEEYENPNLIRLNVPPLPPMERPSPEKPGEIFGGIDEDGCPCLYVSKEWIDEQREKARREKEEPHLNKAAPPGVPIDIPIVTLGDGEEFVDVYKEIDGIKRRIPGVRDFPELRGEKPKIEPVKPMPVIYAAHNSQYDLGILSTAYRRTGVKPPADFVCIDTCAWARKAMKLHGYSLETIVSYIADHDEIEIPFIDIEGDDCLGIDAALFAMQGFHRALCDSFHTAVVLSHLLQVTGMDRDGSTIEDLRKRYPGVVSYGIAEQRTTVEMPLDLAALNDAIASGADVLMKYNGGTSGTRARKIKPLGVYGTKGVAYLEAFCYIDGFVKTFRVDRIREVL